MLKFILVVGTLLLNMALPSSGYAQNTQCPADNREFDAQPLIKIRPGSTFSLKLSGTAEQSWGLGEYFGPFYKNKSYVAEKIMLSQPIGDGTLQCRFFVGGRNDGRVLILDGHTFSMTTRDPQDFVNESGESVPFDPHLESRAVADHELACFMGCSVTSELYVTATTHVVYGSDIRLDGKKISYQAGDNELVECTGLGILPTVGAFRTLIENNRGCLNVPQQNVEILK